MLGWGLQKMAPSFNFPSKKKKIDPTTMKKRKFKSTMWKFLKATNFFDFHDDDKNY